jgi:hypothetical protein
MKCFLDELDPQRGRMTDEISTECDIFCMLAVDDSAEKGGSRDDIQ